MWKKLPCSKPLFLSYTNEKGYFVYVTDYINIWWVHWKENEFLVLLKKSNDDLEMENDNKLLQLGLKMLLEPETLKKLDFSFEDNILNISMTMSCGFPFYLDMKLVQGSKEMFFNKVTQPLLQTIHDLKTSESELRFILIKKDKEIEEYKSETDVRLAMYLKTGVFSDEEHMRKHPVYDDNFGASEISKCLLMKLVDDTEDHVIVKQENGQLDVPVLKIEPELKQPITSETELTAGNGGLSNPGTIKTEIKNESDNISPRKKLRKMLKI